MNMTKIDFELACAAGLNVCTGGESTFNNQVARFAVAVRAPLLAEIEQLHAELDALRSVKQPTQPASSVSLALMVELRDVAAIAVHEAPARHMRRAMDARNALDVILAPLLTQELAVL